MMYRDYEKLFPVLEELKISSSNSQDTGKERLPEMLPFFEVSLIRIR